MSGWPIEHLPTDVLAYAWEEITKRKMTESNTANHSAAVTAGLIQAIEIKETKIEHKSYLPFDLDSLDKPRVQPETVQILERLRDKGELPAVMLRDLYRGEILSPPKK